MAKNWSLLSLLLFTQVGWADITGMSVERYRSPEGVDEECVITQRMPLAQYSDKDLKQEEKFCKINLYTEKNGICPKTWSTSPGTVVYDIEKSGLTPEQFSGKCLANGDQKKLQGVKKIAKFKNTMNSSGTSATYSQASLIYYHFSRYLRSLTVVPPAVYRTIDKDDHRKRVAERGFRISNGTMVKKAWEVMLAAEQNPRSYTPTNELFTEDQKRIYGIFEDGKGDRYGAEFNGIRSGGGESQHNDFQNTAPYLALRSEQPLQNAIKEGVEKGRRDSKINADLGKSVSDQQMIFWMKELTEITLMDHFFCQQDRVGNIDFRWQWHWVENGVLKELRAKLESANGDELARSKVNVEEVQVPAEIARFNPVLLQKTQLNDNDAGVRCSGNAYVNRAAKTKMLEKIRHYPAELYQRLMQLNADMQSRGDIHQWISRNFDMNPKYVETITANIKDAAQILRNTCKSGKLLFDLEPEELLANSSVSPKQVDCESGRF